MYCLNVCDVNSDWAAERCNRNLKKNTNNWIFDMAFHRLKFGHWMPQGRNLCTNPVLTHNIQIHHLVLHGVCTCGTCTSPCPWRLWCAALISGFPRAPHSFRGSSWWRDSGWVTWYECRHAIWSSRYTYGGVKEFVSSVWWNIKLTRLQTPSTFIYAYCLQYTKAFERCSVSQRPVLLAVDGQFM